MRKVVFVDFAPAALGDRGRGLRVFTAAQLGAEMKRLEKTDGRYAFISYCCGGGQSATAAIENLRY